MSHEAGIDPIFADQFLVAAFLHNFAFLQHCSGRASVPENLASSVQYPSME